MINPFKNKYETHRGFIEKKRRVLHLKKITDGSIVTLVDEGPYEDDPDMAVAPPSNGRQNILAQLRKRAPGREDLPLYFYDDECRKLDEECAKRGVPLPALNLAAPFPRVYDRRIQGFVEIPRPSEAILQAMVDYGRIREDRRAVVMREIEEKRAKADAETKESVSKVIAALAEHLPQAEAKSKRGKRHEEVSDAV